MAKKYYAVKIGKTPGVYETWAECQNQINGFSGAVYKGFATKEEAIAFVGKRSSWNRIFEQYRYGGKASG